MEPYVLNIMGAVCLDFTVMDNRVRSHRVNPIDEILENEDNHSIDWPVRFANINPIYKICDALGKAIENPPLPI